MADFLTHINSIDLVIFAVLLTFVLAGILRGFTHDFLGLMTWFGAILVTSFVFPLLRHQVLNLVSHPLLADVVTLVIAFITSMVILVFIAKAIGNRIQRSALSGIDRSFGIFSGLLRSVIILCVVFTTTMMFWIPGETPTSARESRLLPLVMHACRYFYENVVPQDLIPLRIAQHLYGDTRIDGTYDAPDALERAFSSPPIANRSGSDPKSDQRQNDAPASKPHHDNSQAATPEGSQKPKDENDSQTPEVSPQDQHSLDKLMDQL